VRTKSQNEIEPNEQMKQLAYFLWQNAGEPAGTAERDWLFAQHVVETGSVSAPDWSQNCQAEPRQTVNPDDFTRVVRGSS
jgi:hypothetical protein